MLGPSAPLIGTGVLAIGSSADRVPRTITVILTIIAVRGGVTYAAAIVPNVIVDRVVAICAVRAGLDIAIVLVLDAAGVGASGTAGIDARCIACGGAHSTSHDIACDAVVEAAATQRVYFIFYRMRAVYRAGIGFASRGSLNPVRPWP